MTVQDVIRTVAVPQQAGPVEPSPTPDACPSPALAPVSPAPLLGRDRPRTADERQFLLGALAVFLCLSTYIVTGLLLAEFVWK